MALRVGIIGSTTASGAPTWRDYELQAFEKLFLTEGVVSGFAVSQRAAGANMSVDVALGDAIIEITNTNLTPNKTYKVYFNSDATENKAIATADATNPRKDRVVLRVDVSTNPNAAASNVAVLEVLTGTPAVSPSAPAEPSNAVTLAIVDVPAGDTTISDGQITDSRTYAQMSTAVLTSLVRQGLGNMVAAGSGTNTVTASYSPKVTALADRMVLAVVPANDNSGAATFNPDSLGAKDIRKSGNEALSGGEMKAKVPAFLMYHQSDDNWKLLNPQSLSSALLTVESKTADYSVLTADSGKAFDNNGATLQTIAFTLAPAAAGQNCRFTEVEGKHVIVEAASGDTVKSAGLTGDFLYTKTQWSSIHMNAVDATDSVSIALTGTWAGQFFAGLLAGGGGNGSNSNSSVISKLKFSDDTEANSSQTLAAAQGRGSSVSADHWGYCMGGLNSGGSRVATIQKLLFTDESAASIAATLDQVRAQSCGVQSSTKGYSVTGDNAGLLTNMENMDFSNDTSAAVAVTFTGKFDPAGVSSSTAGYIAGGRDGSGETSSIQKLVFSGETISTLAATLDVARSKSAGVQSSTKGYIMTGSTANGATPNATIDDLNFSNDTSAQLAATVDTARDRITGVSGASKGYCCGGTADNGTTASALIDDLAFSGETSAQIAATLDTARQTPFGLSNPA